jgi:hypothetical protein
VSVGLSVPIHGVHLRKEAVVIKVPVILIMSVSRLHIDLDQVENETMPYFMHVTTSEPSFFLSFLLLNRQGLEIS